MATTSLWKMSGSLKKVMDYESDEEKTNLENEQKLLFESINYDSVGRNLKYKYLNIIKPYV